MGPFPEAIASRTSLVKGRLPPNWDTPLIPNSSKRGLAAGLCSRLLLFEYPMRSSFTALAEKTCVSPAATDHESLGRDVGMVVCWAVCTPQLPGAGQIEPRRKPRFSLLNRANSLSRSLKL